MPLKDWPISTKLRLIITAACVVMIGLSGCAFVAFQWLQLRAAMLDGQIVRAEILAQNVTAALAFDDPADARQVLQSLRADPNTITCVIFQSDGRVFTSYRRPGAGSAEVQPLPDGQHRFDAGQLAVRVPVRINGRGFGSVEVVESLAQLQRRIQLSMLGMFILTVLGSGAAYLLAGRFQRWVSAPILRLARVAHAVAERSDYTVRASKLSDDEIGYLTDAFNAMLARIESHERILEARVAERTNDLLAANRELEAFSFSVSHDLRAPLRSILGMAEILLEDHGAELPDPARKHLGSIQRSATRMTQLISDMLEFARQSRREPVLAAVDMAALVQAVIGDFSAEIAGRGVELEIRPLPPSQADAALLRQVLVNLLSNALKYTRDRSPARIEIGSMPTGEPGKAGYFVRDNGVGFDMEYASRLFEPFQRLHGAEKFEGTGVGLALAQRIIQRHGGRMWAESRPNHGAAFFFTLRSHEPARG